MNLRLEELKNVTKKVKQQTQALTALKSELKNIFGSSINMNNPLHMIIDEANTLLAQPRFTETPPEINLNVALVLSTHDNSKIRLLSSKLLPEQYLSRFVNDKSAEVRHSVAHRISPKLLKVMIENFQHDDQLHEIARSRNLKSLLLKEEKQNQYKKLGSAVKQWDGPELDDTWYDYQVSKLMKQYDNNLEYMWEESAVKQLALAMKSVSNVEFDQRKLYDLLKKAIRNKEDKRLKALQDDPLAEQPLKETVEWLKLGNYRKDNTVLEYDERKDSIAELIESHVSSYEYVTKFKSLYKVTESIIPGSLRKQGLSEACRAMQIPSIARLPHNKGITHLDEKALDRFVMEWNRLQTINSSADNDKIKIMWNMSPTEDNRITFEAILR